VSDDGLDGTLGEGALRGFELEFEPEWVDRGPADTQLAFRSGYFSSGIAQLRY